MAAILHKLSAALLVLMLSGLCMALPVDPHSRSAVDRAGCHSQKPDSPKPVSSTCCRAGHDAAILRAGFSFQPMVRPWTPDLVLAKDGFFPHCLFGQSAPASNAPPGFAPLRI